MLVGSKGANVLKGGAGSDYLDGKDGADGLEGGAGGDLLVSRDRVRDAVDCAAGEDQALVDRRDRPKGCERVERGAVPARGGHDVALTPDGCSAKVRPEGWSRFVPLTTGMTAGSGTAIQTAKCEVRIGVRLGSSATAAVLRSGKAELRRVQGALSATVVDAGRCSSKRSKKELGRLTVRSIGLVRVTGRRSRSSGSGATWRTTDRCDATITQVTRGSVLVDPSNGAARRLGAGGRLVAP